MIAPTDRSTHMLFCIAAFIGWYSIAIFMASLPGYTELYRSRLALPLLYALFWLPVTLILWRHYQKRYGTMPLGSVTLSGLLLPGIALIVLSFIHQKFGYQEAWIEQFYEFSDTGLLMTSLVICVGAPFIEEIIFRGFLLNTGLGYGKRGELIAIVITSVLFAIVHSQYQNPTTFVWLFIFSGILCHTRLRTGSLLIPMILHALNNASVFIPLLLA